MMKIWTNKILERNIRSGMIFALKKANMKSFSLTNVSYQLIFQDLEHNVRNNYLGIFEIMLVSFIYSWFLYKNLMIEFYSGRIVFRNALRIWISFNWAWKHVSNGYIVDFYIKIVWLNIFLKEFRSGTICALCIWNVFLWSYSFEAYDFFL